MSLYYNNDTGNLVIFVNNILGINLSCTRKSQIYYVLYGASLSHDNEAIIIYGTFAFLIWQ